MKPHRAIVPVLILFLAGRVMAEPLLDPKNDVQSSTAAPVRAVNTDAIDNWLAEVSAIQAEQPHWATPVVTVTPRLEQEFRYDQSWTYLPHGRVLNNFGTGKGFEFIPGQNMEVIVGIPAYETRSSPAQSGGLGDENLLFKYRLLSANEEHGNYIVTAFMGLSIPTGNPENTSGHFMFTPTIAAGKGWGDFDVQTTLGITVPDDGAEPTQGGTPIAWNTTFQYHILKYFWPEVELNYTYWPNGSREGLNQLYVTPGIVFGKFKIHDRVGLTVGFGYQMPVTQGAQDNHNFILTARVPF